MGELIHMDLYVAKDLIRELNAKDLKRKWKRFIKQQEGKHDRQRGRAEK